MSGQGIALLFPPDLHHPDNLVTTGQGLLHEAARNPFLSPATCQFPDNISALIKPNETQRFDAQDDEA